MRSLVVLVLAGFLAACGGGAAQDTVQVQRLHPGETPELRRLITRTAHENQIPESLLHRVVQRESGYRPHARNGPYYGLMQIMPQTARTMGFTGEPRELLDPEVNLRYGARYLRGAWIVANGNPDSAVRHYARGYYYEARDRCLLVETGLASREVNRRCR